MKCRELSEYDIIPSTSADSAILKAVPFAIAEESVRFMLSERVAGS